jgi:hypothetical protein
MPLRDTIEYNQVEKLQRKQKEKEMEKERIM